MSLINFSTTTTGSIPSIMTGQTAVAAQGGISIPRNVLYFQVSTAAPGTAVTLPASAYIGQSYSIRNDGANGISVFPHSGGQINGLGLNNAYAFADVIATFIAVSSTQWHIVNVT